LIKIKFGERGVTLATPARLIQVSK
jgi:hypothetical protein